MRMTLGLVVLAGFAGCNGSGPAQNTERVVGGPASVSAIRVLTTISTFNSFVSAVGGTRVMVDSLVPVGASPEEYQPTPADIGRLADADLLIENGLGLESWLARTIDNAKNARLKIVVATAGLPRKGNNPHLWMDPRLARGYARNIRDALSTRDPAHRSEYAKNETAYEKRLAALEREIAARIANVPPPSRAMIVFHNAWQYYNDRFGIRTVGIVELSPGQEPSPKYISDLIGLARANHVRAVFAEPEYSPKLVQTLAESAGIATVENLYDDSLGNDPRVHDYESMLRYDTEVIVKALNGRQ
ncbi:MAG: zinc ABC transporter substrate-binding protein [Candidatus Eremiobacteraeota bacterium]|nr:zinc ABC transporter substrate-binding protein [Candidatus Eremiobacteraeota bacterium]